MFGIEIGEDWNSIATALNIPAKTFIRVNTLKITPENLLELLLKENIDAKITNPTALEETGFSLKNCIEISSKNNLKNSTFYDRIFEFQDLGSQLIGEFCDLKSNQTVLDLCAGAGGKSLHLSAILQNKGKIYATDFKPERTKTLANRANNAGCKNIEIISFEKAMFLKNLECVNRCTLFWHRYD